MNAIKDLLEAIDETKERWIGVVVTEEEYNADMKAATAELAELERKISELECDGRRLDLLENHPEIEIVTSFRTEKFIGWHWRKKYTGQGGENRLYLRQAIDDAAMEADKPAHPHDCINDEAEECDPAKCKDACEFNKGSGA